MLLKISLNAKGTRFPYCFQQSLLYEPAVLAHNSFRYSSLFITFIAFNQREVERRRDKVISVMFFRLSAKSLPPTLQ